MKKLVIVVTLVAMLAASAGVVMADKPVAVDSNGVETAWANSMCTKIQSGLLKYSAGHYLAGQPLVVGFDAFGYNYQAHMFEGSYANVYLGRAGFPPYAGDDAAYLAANPAAANHWAWPYRSTRVVMKWNDAWLSNVDCGPDDVSGPKDGLLDRHFGFASYQGSGAWETNHMQDVNGDGSVWTYFVKIVAVPTGAIMVPNDWTDTDGSTYHFAWSLNGAMIGPDIQWGPFAVVQEIYNDPSAGTAGLYFKSTFRNGFGGW